MSPGSASSVDLTTLLGLTRFLAGTLDRVGTFTDAQILALLNIEMDILQAEILQALNYDWKESTLDGTGSGAVNLVADDKTYAFPTDMIQIDRIEINYTGNTDGFVPARIIPLQAYKSQALTNISTTSREGAGSEANPIVHIRNKVIHTDPMPKTSVTSGIRIWGQTLMADLTAGGSAPVFEAAFHEILAYGAAQRWCAAKDKQGKGDRLLTERALKLQNMIAFYSTRDATEQPIIRPIVRSMK